MSLSEKTKEILVVAMANKKAAEEVAAAIDSGSNPQAASVSAIGTTAALVGTDGSAGAGDAAPLAETESRLDTVESKIDAVIAALKAAGLMA